jgi:hypothetical protein
VIDGKFHAAQDRAPASEPDDGQRPASDANAASVPEIDFDSRQGW